MRALILLLFLTACSATGPEFKDVSIPVSKDSATVVIYRPKATPLFGEGGMYSVEVNGQEKCMLHNSAFLVADKLSGVVNVSSSVWSEPGTTRIKFQTRPGKISYVRMQMNDSRQATAILTGYVGLWITEGVSSQSGPFVFTLVEESQAKEELKALRLEEKCA